MSAILPDTKAGPRFLNFSPLKVLLDISCPIAGRIRNIDKNSVREALIILFISACFDEV